MFNPQALLDQMLGGQAGNTARGMGQSVKGALDQYSGSGGFARGAAAGGLLGLLLGGKGVGKMAGGALRYGGAAALGALALQAYQTWQKNQGQPGGAPVSMTPEQFANLSPQALPHAQPAADGGSFQMVLIRAMIGAAKSDGHVDETEQRRLFGEIEKLGLDAGAKGLVFDLLAKPVELSSITSAVATPEQAAEVYLASRLAINPDVPAELAWLDALAARLQLPVDLRRQLDAHAA
jgi:uncharacterized membrane protein YebE (DUF533 family)